MPTENRSTSNPGPRTFTLDSLVAALGQVQALHEISADLIAERIFGQPAEQHQREPDAWYDPEYQEFLTAEGRATALRMGHGDRLSRYTVRLFAAPTAAEELDSVRHWRRKHADVMRESDTLRAKLAVPDGYCIMPRQLTAENGAKALLLGEFKLEVTRECPECLELDEPVEGCEICDGEGEYGQRHTIPWEQIKFIYSEAVRGLALQPHTALDRKS